MDLTCGKWTAAFLLSAILFEKYDAVPKYGEGYSNPITCSKKSTSKHIKVPIRRRQYLRSLQFHPMVAFPRSTLIIQLKGISERSYLAMMSIPVTEPRLSNGHIIENEEDEPTMEKKTNYKGLFWAGFTFMAAGIALSITLGPVGIGLVGVGIAMMAVGLSKRDQWDQK